MVDIFSTFSVLICCCLIFVIVFVIVSIIALTSKSRVNVNKKSEPVRKDIEFEDATYREK